MLYFLFFLASGIFSTILHGMEESKVLVIEGKYQSRNLYVQNSFSATGVGFCVYEVTVNGSKTTDEVNSSAFEVDLSRYQFKQGDPVLVEIKHKEKCLPKVINPEALKPVATFDVIAMNVSDDGLFTWSTKKENGSLPYYIQQFRWSKWVTIGEVEGKGYPDIQEYSFKVELHSGINKFRVKQTGYGQPRFSKEVSITSVQPPVTMSIPEKSPNEVHFSKETKFEVYDLYGAVVKTGFGSTINLTELKKGKYYISFDNNTSEFVKKK